MRRSLVSLLTIAALSLVVATSAFACGTAGYSYAGVSSTSAVSGVSTQLTSLTAPAVQNGHVAGWVGVGGPGLGPNGSSEWIQVGYAGFPGLTLSSLYYEVALPGHAPTFHEVATAIRPGEQHRVAVREVPNHANSWRVWVDGKAVSAAYRLPGSHGTWRAIATAENWGGGQNACNLYSYKFNHVAVTGHTGGTWRALTTTYTMHQGNNRFHSTSASSFTASTTTTAHTTAQTAAAAAPVKAP
jgi:hypothetical protein